MTEFWPDPISAMRAYFERESKRGLGPRRDGLRIPTDRVERLRVAVDAFRRIDRVSPTQERTP